MSCDAVAFSAFLWLASAGGAPGQAAEPVPISVAAEPLFADIVRRAGGLKTQAEALRANASPIPDAFRAEVGELAALDMKGHEDLKARAIDGDLKCILKGIAQDLPVRLNEVDAAADTKARDAALREMVYLLRDNVEVITAPPKPPV